MLLGNAIGWILAAGAAAVAGWTLVRLRNARSLNSKRSQFVEGLLRDREAERARLAGELHSSLGQNLLLIKHRAEMGLREDGDSRAACEQLHAISELSSETIAEARQLAHGLAPRFLLEIGLAAALDAMIDRVESVTPIKFQRRLETVDGLFDSVAAINIYRVAQEALNNVLKHSQARQVSVELLRDLKEVRLTIQDDGKGVTTRAANGESHAGLGLAEMRERARILGAHFQLDCGPGGGARLRLTVPIQEAVATQLPQPTNYGLAAGDVSH